MSGYAKDVLVETWWVRRDFLGPGAFSEPFGSHGVSSDHTVVLYGDRNNWFAAYAYWYLKHYGHRNVKLINGPREEWMAEGRATTAALPCHPPAGFRAGHADDRIRARRHEVLATLVDVRSPQEYRGELMAMPGYEFEGAQRAGHHELLGREDVKNYDGSWTEWGNLVNVPVEKG